jgi:hypothetical protein
LVVRKLGERLPGIGDIRLDVRSSVFLLLLVVGNGTTSKESLELFEIATELAGFFLVEEGRTALASNGHNMYGSHRCED